MQKKNSNQLSFEEVTYKNPDSNNTERMIVSGKPEKSRLERKPREKLPESLQPFLPGLSRRGRPRAKNPIPPTVRASESRKRRVEAGVKRLELLLEPAVAADLDLLVAHFKITRVELISRLLVKAAKPIRTIRTKDPHEPAA